MVSERNTLVEETLDEIEFNDDDISASKPNRYIQVNILSNETGSSDPRRRRKQLLDFLKASVSKAFSVFRKTVDEREEISVSVPSRVGIRQHVDTQFIRRINFPSLVNIFKEWIRHPMNVAFLVWLVCVAVSATMLGLLLLGLLNKAFPMKSSRNRWIEINNQVLNALFTLMSLYQHPNLFPHLVLLCRWRAEDIIELRKTYCKNGAYRPHEWAHIILVVVLLHITCFSQYVQCGLYWGYSRKLRPEFAEDFSFSLWTIAPIIAGLYTIYSPLGREFSSDTEEELHDVKVSNKARVVSKPEWNGGLFDCSGDRTTGFLSFCCTFCIFGWNMERLGFGNMYVHMVTVFLLCVAPIWIFSISALNISNDVIRDVVGISGMVLCVFGLLYGGFWRIKMRERFGLPGNSFCCGSDSMTDYVQWMFCWTCSLAQEVRTVNFYDVEDDSFHRKCVDSDEESCTCPEMDRDCNAQDDQFPVKQQLESNVVMMPPITECIETDERSVTPASTSHAECSVSDLKSNCKQKVYREFVIGSSCYALQFNVFSPRISQAMLTKCLNSFICAEFFFYKLELDLTLVFLKLRGK